MDELALQKKRKNEKETVRFMIGIYCHGNHGTKKGELCDSCSALADYCDERVDKCPKIEQKTFCSSCTTHCYLPAQREEIRQAMRYAGPRMMFYSPGKALRHGWEQVKSKLE